MTADGEDTDLGETRSDPIVDPGTGKLRDDAAPRPGTGSGSTPTPPPGFAELLDELAAEVEHLDERVEKLEEQRNTAPDGPWTWATLSTQDRQALWVELYEWVAWLEDRYLRNIASSKLTPLHADWYRNPVAVELFTALMVAHHSVYKKQAAAPSFALVEWHERCLWPTLTRMETLGILATALEAKDWDGPFIRPTRRNDDRFNQYVDEDLAAHHIDEHDA